MTMYTFTPRRAARSKRGGELVADLARLVDEGFEADPPLGVIDRLEHRGENLVAVGQHVVPVAAREIRADKRRNVRGRAGIVRGDGAPHLQGLLVLRDHEEKPHHDRDNGENDERPAPAGFGHVPSLCNLVAEQVWER